MFDTKTNTRPATRSIEPQSLHDEQHTNNNRHEILAHAVWYFYAYVHVHIIVVVIFVAIVVVIVGLSVSPEKASETWSLESSWQQHKQCQEQQTRNIPPCSVVLLRLSFPYACMHVRTYVLRYLCMHACDNVGLFIHAHVYMCGASLTIVRVRP